MDTTGEEEIASPSLTIENMDRHKGGTYICTADNGVGQPATSLVVLHVLCEYPLVVNLGTSGVVSGVKKGQRKIDVALSQRATVYRGSIIIMNALHR